jgi:hypothetical protein
MLLPFSYFVLYLLDLLLHPRRVSRDESVKLKKNQKNQKNQKNPFSLTSGSGSEVEYKAHQSS